MHSMHDIVEWTVNHNRRPLIIIIIVYIHEMIILSPILSPMHDILCKTSSYFAQNVMHGTELGRGVDIFNILFYRMMLKMSLHVYIHILLWECVSFDVSFIQ